MTPWYRDDHFHDADAFLQGNIVVAVPHSDDEMLGCGIILSQIRDKNRVRFVYASDGSQSPEPVRQFDPSTGILPALRVREACSAIGQLGYSAENASFLGLPDGRLNDYGPALVDAIATACEAHSASTLLAPFRMDLHPDHLAVHLAARQVACSKAPRLALYEYFVYFRSRLLPRGDVRAYVKPEFRTAFYSVKSAAAKRAALDCYVSQRTIVFPWQTRAVLQDNVIDQTTNMPEFLAHAGAHAADDDLLSISPSGVHFLQFVERQLKRAKDRVLQLVASVFR